MSSTLSKIRIKKDEAYSWKNIKPIYKAVQQIKNIDIIDIKVVFDDTIYISTTQNIKSQDKEAIYEALRLLIPWRKGPFDIFGIELQAEWRSDIKYNILRPHFDIKNKIVADIGCNNGYYMFKMNQDRPKKLIGFDPSAVYKLQFDFLNHFIKTDIVFEMIGVEYLKLYNHKFDTIFMLGVLYHRPDRSCCLKCRLTDSKARSRFSTKCWNKTHSRQLCCDLRFLSGSDLATGNIYLWCICRSKRHPTVCS